MIVGSAEDVKRQGKHYTPFSLARFLAQRALEQFEAPTRLRVLDPACGDGELLLAAHQVAQERFPNVEIELVGCDLDEAAVESAHVRLEAEDVRATLVQGDSLELLTQTTGLGFFDLVITNPPYVRTQQLGAELSRQLATEHGLTGRVDLTHAFVAVVAGVLVSGGVLALLSSNRFLTTKAGANVREVLSTRLRPVEVYDLGDTRLFAAAVLPAITISINSRERSGGAPASFASAYRESDSVETTASGLFEGLASGQDCVVSHDGVPTLLRFGTLLRGATSEEPWRMSRADSDEWLAQVAAGSWSTIGALGKVRVGVKTTADKVFISRSWEDLDQPPESELLLPLVTHDNVTPWSISEQLNTRILYPYDLENDRRSLVDMVNYPRSMAYLKRHEAQLAGRQYVVDGGRKWFEIWVPQRPHLWKLPKIVFPDISENARFALDTTGAVVNGDCYWISLADIRDMDLAYLILAVANSRLGLRFYDEVCGNKLYSGKRRWISQYVERLPIPDPGSAIAQEIIAIVGACTDRGTEPSPAETELLERLVVEAFAAPVDQAVHERLF